jgi:hypothetical protein
MSLTTGESKCYVGFERKARSPVLAMFQTGLAQHNLIAVSRDPSRSIARVHHQRRCFHNRLIVVAGMVGGDDHAIKGGQIGQRQVDGAQRRICSYAQIRGSRGLLGRGNAGIEKRKCGGIGGEHRPRTCGFLLSQLFRL